MKNPWRSRNILLVSILYTVLGVHSLSAAASLSVNGSSQYVSVPADSSLTPSQFTLEAWIKTSTTGLQTIVSRGEGNNGAITDYIFQLSNDGASIGNEVSLFAGGAWDVSASSIPLNTWTHVAVTFDGHNKLFYINGVLNRTAPRNSPVYSTPGSPLYIGRQGSVCNCNFFNGSIAEVRVWNTVRSASQISDDMNSASSSSQSGLLAYYHLNEGSGTIANDVSGNGHAGTLMNGASWGNTAPQFSQLAVTTLSPTNLDVSAGSALAQAMAYPNGTAATVFFQYGTNLAYGATSSPILVSSGSEPILATAPIFPNLPNVTYHIRAVATNSTITVFGDDVSFLMPLVSPLVSTGAVVQVTATNAIVSAQVDPRGATANVFARYGTVGSSFGYGYITAVTNASGTGPGTVTFLLPGLQPNSTYFFGVTAYDGAGTNSVDDLSFTTGPLAPSVSSPTASSINGQNFAVSALVNPNSTLTAIHFECVKVGDTIVITSPTNIVAAGSDPVTLSAQFNQLVPNTCYNCSVVAANAGGTAMATQTVCTVPFAPSVTMSSATGVSAISATLNGNVVPNGAATTVSFNYGTTPALGSSTPSIPIGNGTSPVPVSQFIGGLLPNTLYYYRVIAANASGQITGAMSVFTTTQTPPPVNNSPSNSITLAVTQTRQAQGVAFAVNGTLSVFLTNGGAGYTSPPNVTVSLTSGTGTNGTVVAGLGPDGSVNSLTVQNPGNYSSPAEVSITIDPPPNPIQAAISNATYSVIVLPAGSFDANTIITRNVTIRGQGSALTRVTGGNRDSVFKVPPGVTVTFEDLTISEGSADYGGGIYNNGGTVTVNRCRITDNHAVNSSTGEGGGIFNQGFAQCTVNDSEIDHNTSSHNGAGISSSGLNTALFPWLVGGLNTTSNALVSLKSVISDPSRFGLKVVNSAKGAIYSVPDLGTAVATRLTHPQQLGSDFVGALQDLTPSSIEDGLTRLTHADLPGNATTNSYDSTSWLSFKAAALTVNRTRIHDNSTASLAATFGGGIDNAAGLVVLTDCEIDNNQTTSSLGAFGGGISSVLGAIRLVRCNVHNNVASSATVVCDGGAIFSAASLVSADNSDFNNNNAKAIYRSRGGAIENMAGGQAILTLCTLNGNSSGGGGAIQNEFLATLSATNCTISGNSVSGIIGANGGGVGNDQGGTLTLVGCTLDHNVATGFARGGGIFNHCNYEELSPPGIDDQSITLVQQTTATLINCTLSSNAVAGSDFDIPDLASLAECEALNLIKAGSCSPGDIPPAFTLHFPAQGGAAYNGSESDSAVGGQLANPATAELDLLSCTLVGNSATGGNLFTNGPYLVTDGGGVFVTDSSSLEPGRWGISMNVLDNSLLADNQLNGSSSDFRLKALYPFQFQSPLLAVVNPGPDLDSDGSLAAAIKVKLNPVLTQANPPLGALAHNGGPTETHALLTGNTALNNGSTNAPATDQRGVSRPQNGVADIGAFEAAAPSPAADSYVTLEDHPLQVGAAAGVLSNDFGAAMIAGLSGQASHGTVILSADGGFVYTPAQHYVGPDSFFYTNLDGSGLTGGPTMVSIQVDPILHLLTNSPAMGSANGALDQLSLTFDEFIDSSLISTDVIVRGAQSVVQPFTVTTSNTVVQINPAARFHPGELVTVELLRSLVGTNGSVFPQSKIIQYVTQVPAGSGQFPTVANLDQGYTTTIVLADFDGNGTIDAYVGGVSHDEIWLNDGHGNFTLRQTLVGNTTAAAAADLNGDGFPDLIVTKAGGLTSLPPAGTVNPQFPSDYNRVYFNDGTGHFVDSGQQLVPGTFVDPDTAPDPNTFQPITFTLNTSYGSYGNNWQYLITTYTPDITQFYHYLNEGSSGVAIGDLNGDGYPDIFIINDTSKTVLGHTVSTPGNTVWLNNGRGSFTRVGPTLGTVNAHSVVLADVDGNGTLDAIVAANDGTEIWLNDGNANFTNATTLQVSDDQAWAVAVGDVNGDGTMDIISSNLRPYYDLQFPLFGDQVFLNDGLGHFTAGQFFGHLGAYGLALGDLNGDGRLDLFATGLLGNEVWLNTGTNFVQTTPPFGTEHFGRAVALADLDGDGDLDAFVGNYGYTNDNCQIWFNDAQPTVNNLSFSVAEDSSLSVPPFGVLSGASDSDSPALLLQTNTVRVYTAPTLGALFGLVYKLPDFNAKNFSYDSQGNNIYLQTVPVYANHGALNLQPDGSFTYTPQPLFHGPDGFSFVVSDGFLSATGNVSITVTPVNHAPLPHDDFYPLTANPLVVNAANGVLANDSDPDGDSITVSLAQPPAHGAVTLNADGSFTYTATTGYTGADSFLYRVSDGLTNAIGRVKLGNTPPIARDDLNYSMPANGLLTVASLNGVLVNDSDADGDVLSATIAIPPAHGNVTLNSDGSFSYVRATNYTGSDSFTYRAGDGLALSAPARVKIGNTPPAAFNDGPYTAFLNQPLTVSAAQGVLANDQDADGDSLTARLASSPANGTVTLNADGSFTYTPNPGYSGNDSFTYVANDGLADSPAATVNVGVYGFLHVTGLNPPANSVSLSTNSIQIRFDGNLDPAGVAGKILVHGSLSGVHTWTAVVATNEVTLTLPEAFAPGENVSVSLLAGLKGEGYLQLANGFTYEFTLGAPRGSANFISKLVGTADAYHSGVVAGDLNGDGLPDAITINGGTTGDNARVYWNQGNGAFLEQPIGTPGDSGRYRAMVLGDFDGNGSLDAFAVGVYPEFWQNDGAGNMTITQLPPAPYFVQFLAVGDFNRDGALDVFACGADTSVLLTNSIGVSYFPTVFWVWFNDGHGHFTMGPQTRVSASLMTGSVIDVNGDGAPDLWLSGITGDQIWLNDGTGQFTADPQTLGAGWGLTVATGDLNGDGFPDAVVYYLFDRARVWFNDGHGKFTPDPQPLLPTNNVIQLALGDLQGNGRLDLAVACREDVSGSNGISLVLTNDGTGHFFGRATATSSSDCSGVALADFDHNGSLDAFFAVGLNNPGTNEVWLNPRLPLANDDFYAGTTTSVPAPGVLANDVPGDGPQFDAILDSQAAHGTVTLSVNGGFTFAPGGGFSGADVFTYHIDDGLQISRIARVKLGNTTPIANADAYNFLNDAPQNVAQAQGVLANDTDADNDSLLALLNQAPAHGTVQLNGDGSFIYTANAGYTGSDTFTYRATDRYSTSAVATVTLTVRARLSVIQKAPAAGASAVPAGAGLTIEFNHPLDPTSVPGQLTISGSLSGSHASAMTTVSNVISATPAGIFRPGELVSITLGAGLRGTLGEQMASPFVWQFTVSAPFGVGQITNSGQQLIVPNETNAWSVALADVDGDGFLDAIVSQTGEFNSGSGPILLPGTGGTMVWHNNGHGVFSDTGQRLATNNVAAPTQVLPLDVNGDGAPDFVVTRNPTTGELWTNNGSGTFGLSPQTFSLSDQPAQTNTVAVASGDFNGDGKPDLAFLHVTTPTVSNPTQIGTIGIWTNNGHGVFVDSGELRNIADTGPSSLLVGDVFGHGALDIIEINYSGARVWENDGTGRFTDSGKIFGSGFGAGAAIGDLNGDGTLDVVANTTSSATIWLNDGQGNFSSTGQSLGSGGLLGVRLADMDGDGFWDIVLIAVNGPSNTSRIYYNNGAANFTDRGTAVGAPSVLVRSAAVGDLNGDGAPDLFLVNNQSPRTVWFNGAGLGQIANANAATSTINDTSTIAPFGGMTLQTPPGAFVTITVQIDDPAKGAFTPASLIASGFTGPVGNVYSLTANPVADAQAALRKLIFAPVPNREPVGQGETTSFTIIVSDGTTSRTNTPAQVTAISVNDPPVANNDSGAGFATTEAAAFTTGNVLANDTDPDPGDSTNLVVASFSTEGCEGLVTNLGNGTFSYNPNGAFNSLSQGATTNDTFTYVATDNHGGFSTGKVSITITGLNNPPIANDDDLTLNEHAGLTPLSALLLQNDSDPDAGETITMTISAVNTNGTHGAVVFSGGTISYNPDGLGNLPLGSNALDHFSYTVQDVHGATATASVNLTIVGQNDSPVAGDDALSLPANNPATNITSVLLANDSDPDPGETATLNVLSINPSAARGVLGFTNGAVWYQPGPQFLALPAGSNAVDTFSYVIQDVHGASTQATVTITNIGVNDPPVARPGQVTVFEGQTTNLTGVMLANDFDPDAGETPLLSVSAIFTNGAAGTLLFTNGNVSYTASASMLMGGQTASDAFTYQISDPHGLVATGAVAITVLPINHAPVAGQSSIIINALSGATNVTAALLGGASDPDPGDTATLALAGVFTNGTIGAVTFSNGVVFYDPKGQFGFLKPGQTSADTFLYSVSDQYGASSIGSARVLITAAPIISQVAFTNGQVHLHIVGIANATCTVFVSSNLVDWSVAGAAIESSSGNFDFYDPVVGGQRGRFYRVEFSNIPFIVTTPAPPRILSVSMQSGDQLMLTFSALAGSYTILGSTNLVQWQPVGSATQLSPGIYQFLDTNAMAFPRRFYRVLSQ